MSKARNLSKITPDTNGVLNSTGINLTTLGYRSVQVFSTAGTYTWTKPSGVTKIKVFVTGGGGGGGCTNSDDMAGGGGAGGTAIKTIDVSSVSSVSVTVGAGRVGYTDNQSTSETAGNASSFGSYCTAAGGYTGGNGWAIAGRGGDASGGDLNITGGDGQGGAIDVTVTYQTAGMGGASYWGGGGRGATRNITTANRDGVAPGSGGGGGATTSQGRTGASGIVVVEEYYS